MEEELKKLVERLWNDIAGLPWLDAAWRKDNAFKEQTKQHFVKYTTEDILKLMEAHNAKPTSKDD